jgi:hypothetical protein
MAVAAMATVLVVPRALTLHRSPHQQQQELRRNHVDPT